MKSVHVAMIALAVVQVILTGIAAFGGGLADGGTVWGRALLMVVHPAAAIALLVMVLSPWPGFKWVAVPLLVVSIAGDGAIAVAIGLGVETGDKFLPLMFAVIPAIGVVYGLTRGAGQTRGASPGMAR